MKITWSVITFILLSLILIRPPKRIGIKSVTTTTRSLGSPREAESFLNILTLSVLFFDVAATLLL